MMLNFKIFQQFLFCSLNEEGEFRKAAATVAIEKNAFVLKPIDPVFSQSPHLLIVLQHRPNVGQIQNV